MTAPLDRILVEVYDGLLRYHVPSRRRNVDPYLVELDAFGFNGCCQCKHFVCVLEPILARGITPEQAHAGGLAEVPPWGTLEDCLRCWHVHAARLKFADDVIQAIAECQRTDEPHDEQNRAT